MVLIFNILFLVGVTPTETDHEKGRIKVIHTYIHNKQKLQCVTFTKKEAFYYATTGCLADHI
jgi:hypothetical protein